MLLEKLDAENANVTVAACEDQTVTWNSIDWKVVNKQVNNLRRRIYRASAAMQVLADCLSRVRGNSLARF
jgi:hypothetical protein